MVRMLYSLIVLGLLVAAPQAQSASPGSPSPAKPLIVVNLNTATATELATLPGIGDKTALRIIEYRQKNGPFKKVEELMNVQGVGEKSFLKLKPQLTVAAKPDSTASSRQD